MFALIFRDLVLFDPRQCCPLLPVTKGFLSMVDSSEYNFAICHPEGMLAPLRFIWLALYIAPSDRFRLLNPKRCVPGANCPVLSTKYNIEVVLFGSFTPESV